MKFTNALKKIASTVWDKYDPTAVYCLTPSRYSSSKNLVHDSICDKIGATHYKMIWQDKGKSVKLTFYSAECYGATYKLGDIVFTTVIGV